LLPDFVDGADVGTVENRGPLSLTLEAGQCFGGLWLLHREETLARRIGVGLRPQLCRLHPSRHQPSFSTMR
jgi:hypothetical protein